MTKFKFLFYFLIIFLLVTPDVLPANIESKKVLSIVTESGELISKFELIEDGGKFRLTFDNSEGISKVRPVSMSDMVFIKSLTEKVQPQDSISNCYRQLIKAEFSFGDKVKTTNICFSDKSKNPEQLKKILRLLALGF